MEFRLLGPVEAIADGRAVLMGGTKQRALLGMLLINANRVVPAARLIEWLWGDEPPNDPGHALHAQISLLRRSLGSQLIGRPPGYLLQVERDRLDVDRFRRLASEARSANDPKVLSALLGEALALWRGPALADFADEPWAAGEAARLDQMRRAAMEDRFEAELAMGRHSDVVAELEAAVREHADSERLWAQLMLALYRAGRRVDATAAYQRAVKALRDLGGLDPSRSLATLYEQIQRQDTGLDLAAPAATPSVEPGPAPVLRLGSRDVPLVSSSTVVGRQSREPTIRPDVDLSDLDPTRSVSRRHAELFRRPDGFHVRDLGSLNGTFVNGGRLEEGAEERVQSGDRLTFGSVTSMFWENPDTTLSVNAGAVADR